MWSAEQCESLSRIAVVARRASGVTISKEACLQGLDARSVGLKSRPCGGRVGLGPGPWMLMDPVLAYMANRHVSDKD